MSLLFMIRKSRFHTTFPRSLNVLTWLSFRDWIIAIPSTRYAAGCEDIRLTCGRTGSRHIVPPASSPYQPCLSFSRCHRHETSIEVQQITRTQGHSACQHLGSWILREVSETVLQYQSRVDCPRPLTGISSRQRMSPKASLELSPRRYWVFPLTPLSRTSQVFPFPYRGFYSLAFQPRCKLTVQW